MSLSPDRAPRALDFELLAEIAVGATARIELCRVTAGARTGELVAVKRLHAYIAEDPQFLDMFRDEVWMTAALKHRHVVEVLGWGEDAEGPYLAVECVRGVSLARLMKTVFDTGEVFSERMVVFLGACICEGLAAAHAVRSAEGELLHLVHRDLTPGNVLLGFDGEVKITDFGLAKAKSRLTKTLTGLLKGQPQFMSPEQVRSEPLDARSDIFALGVLLFELFAGRGPWNATNELDVMRAITERAPLDLRTLRPKLDRALADVVARCLEKRPDSRFQSARELGARLDQWLAAHGYREDNQESLSRFVRRNAMRQMRWFERAVGGEFVEQAREERRADRARGGPARPRDHTHDDESTEQPPPEDSDWGAEDGPTLIKKSASARAMIEALRGKGRGGAGGAGAPGEGRPSGKGAARDTPAAGTGATSAAGAGAPGERKSERGEDETRPVGRAAVARALAKLTEGRPAAVVVPPAIPSDADDTARRRAVTAAAGASRPGVIAPPDPEAPPVPSVRPPAPGTAAGASS
ncbi:MAG: serine/threonine protein kinase, partial [Myxococcales bacterium]|nr:serine/threonine protein kinase [Myxococcales bacterium]